jgi:hypothetical protein
MDILVSAVYVHFYELLMYSLCLCSFILFVYSSIYLCNRFVYYFMFLSTLINVIVFVHLSAAVESVEHVA